MPISLVLPDQYGLVLAAATSTFFVNAAHMFRTARARKGSGVKYPNAYATAEQADKDNKAYVFNCAQRAHANFTENQPSVLTALLIGGLRFPFAAGILGAAWSFFRVWYLYGYTSQAGPKGRITGGGLASLCQLALGFMAAYTSFALVAGN